MLKWNSKGTAVRPLFVTIVLICMPTGSLRAVDWPQFRGPTGDGQAVNAHLPLQWGGFLTPPVWQASIPGTGWSSPVVIGDRVWLTAAEQTALSEEERALKLKQNPYGEDEFQVHGAVTLLAVEIDANNGQLLRRIELFTKDNPAPIHTWNSYASPTPVSDGERVYCHFGSLGTAAIDIASGEILWKKQFSVDDITGPGSSPALCDEFLILVCDGVDDQFVAGLKPETGEIAWRAPRPPIDTEDGKQRRGFSTPLVFEHNGRKQVVAPGPQWAVSYDPANGHERWRVNFGTGHAVVPRPVYHDGIVYVCTGYPQHDLWAVRVDGTGDVTDTHVVWKYTKQAPEISSPVLVDEHLYFVTSTGIASCLNRDTGEILWQQRLGGTYAASPLASDGKLYFTNQTGTTIVVRPGPTYEELARNNLFGQTLASFAVYGNAILIRTDTTLYCVREEQ